MKKVSPQILLLAILLISAVIWFCIENAHMMFSSTYTYKKISDIPEIGVLFLKLSDEQPVFVLKHHVRGTTYVIWGTTNADKYRDFCDSLHMYVTQNASMNKSQIGNFTYWKSFLPSKMQKRYPDLAEWKSNGISHACRVLPGNRSINMLFREYDGVFLIQFSIPPPHAEFDRATR